MQSFDYVGKDIVEERGERFLSIFKWFFTHVYTSYLYIEVTVYIYKSKGKYSRINVMKQGIQKEVKHFCAIYLYSTSAVDLATTNSFLFLQVTKLPPQMCNSQFDLLSSGDPARCASLKRSTLM